MRRVGRRWSEYVVDAEAVRQVLAGTPVTSGLLAPNTLATGYLDGQPFYVTLIAPRKVKVATAGGRAEAREWVFVTPPIVWAGWQDRYRIFALHQKDLVKGWPKHAGIPLYLAPFANTYNSGDICWGTGTRPGSAELLAMDKAFTVYAEESYFINQAGSSPSKQFGGEITRLYATLGGRKAYPCDDLKTQGKTLAYVLSGDAFRVSLNGA
jgi:hypothetical protein